MKKLKSIFIKIDEYIFQKIDLFKVEGGFQKLNEPFSALDENQQKTLAQILTFSLLLIPYFFVISLWWGNHNAKKRVEIKKQIIEQVKHFTKNKQELSNVASEYLSTSVILTQDDLNNKIRTNLTGANIDQTKVSLLNFTPISTTSSIAKIEAVLSFKDFGTLDLSNFLNSLTSIEKFKIVSINLEKNISTNLLQGEISLIHLGKNTAF